MEVTKTTDKKLFSQNMEVTKPNSSLVKIKMEVTNKNTTMTWEQPKEHQQLFCQREEEEYTKKSQVFTSIFD